MDMEALQAAIAPSQTVSVDSDTSRAMETGADRPGASRRGRKQAKPVRGLDSSDGCVHHHHGPPAAAHKQQHQQQPQQSTALVQDTSSGESPMCLSSQRASSSQATAAAVASVAIKQASSSKISPAQRQGPCGHCKTPYSPQWRKGPRNKPVLCNACGIRFLRNRHLGRTVPQKKRSSSGPSAKAAAGDSSAGEASVDTSTVDTTDMRGASKKRKNKKGDMADEDTSAYSYGTMGSVGSFHQLLQHQHNSNTYSDTDHACADADTMPGRGSDVSHQGTRAGVGVSSMQLGAAGAGDAAAPAAAGASSGTFLAMPGNMQQTLLAPVGSLASSSGIYGGGYSMALALQLYQQQQQQLLLSQQQLLMSQASYTEPPAAQQTAAAGGSAPNSAGSSPSTASVLQTQGSSAPGSPAQSSAGAGQQASPAQASNLLVLQLQQLHGYLLQQQQHAQVLQAAGMLHGPSPLSVMSSGPSSLPLGGTGGAAAAGLTAALPAVPSLEIAPLVCGGQKQPTAGNDSMPAHSAPAEPAASVQVPATTGTVLAGSTLAA